MRQLISTYRQHRNEAETPSFWLLALFDCAVSDGCDGDSRNEGLCRTGLGTVAQAGDFSLVQGAILAPIVIGAGDAKVVSLAARLKRANLVLPDSPQNKSGNSVVDCNLYRWQGRFAQCVDDISRDGDGGTMTHALCGAFVRKMHQMAHLFPMDQIA